MTESTSPILIHTSCMDFQTNKNGAVWCFTGAIEDLSDRTQKWRLSMEGEGSKLICYLEESFDKPRDRIRKWRFDEDQRATKIMAIEDNKISIELYGTPLEILD